MRSSQPDLWFTIKLPKLQNSFRVEIEASTTLSQFLSKIQSKLPKNSFPKHFRWFLEGPRRCLKELPTDSSSLSKPFEYWIETRHISFVNQLPYIKDDYFQSIQSLTKLIMESTDPFVLSNTPKVVVQIISTFILGDTEHSWPFLIKIRSPLSQRIHLVS